MKRASTWATRPAKSRERAAEAAAKGRDIVSQGRETLTTAIERGEKRISRRARESRRDHVDRSVLGVIAVATLSRWRSCRSGFIVAAGILARRLSRLTDRVEREMTPIFGHLNAIGRDASRAAALATAQVERADQLFADLAVRVEQTLNTVQASLGRPAREGRALFSALRAGLHVLRDLRRNARARQGRSDDEDALFI